MAKSSPICPQGAVVEIKKKIVEGKRGEGSRPTINLSLGGHTASTQLPHSFFTTFFSSHVHSTDQKHKKQSKFPSSFFKLLFISF
jgi:hypothetical protein